MTPALDSAAEIFRPMPTHRADRACPLCDTEASAERDGPIACCHECGLHFRADTSIADECVHWSRYTENHTEQTYDRHRAPYYRTLWKWIRALPRGTAGDRTILDVGCVPGMLLREARADGWTTHGVETSPELCELTREFCGAHVWEGYLEEVDFGAARFDLITFCDVFRQVSNPRAALEACARLLKPGGCVVLREINAGHRKHQAGRLQTPYPFDMQFIDALGARRFLHAAGFQSVEIHNCPMSLLTMRSMSQLARTIPPAYHAVLGATNAAVRVLDLAPRVSGQPTTPSLLAAGFLEEA